MAADYQRRGTNGLARFLGWLTLLVTLAGTAFTLYGRLVSLEARMAEADDDRHEIIAKLDRIETMLTARGRVP